MTAAKVEGRKGELILGYSSPGHNYRFPDFFV